MKNHQRYRYASSISEQYFSSNFFHCRASAGCRSFPSPFLRFPPSHQLSILQIREETSQTIENWKVPYNHGRNSTMFLKIMQSNNPTQCQPTLSSPITSQQELVSFNSTIILQSNKATLEHIHFHRYWTYIIYLGTRLKHLDLVQIIT